MRSFAALLCCLFAGWPIVSAGAQSPVPAGSRVRVSGMGLAASVVGNFQTVRSDTVVVLEEGEDAQVWNVPVADVRRFEISEGWHTRNGGMMLKWGLIGAAGGAAIGAVVSVLLEAGADANENYKTGLNALVGAGIGGGIGAYYGSTRSIERWRSVSIPRRVGLVPTRGGVALVAAF